MEYTSVTNVLALWLNFIMLLASPQPPLMVLTAEMQSREAEPSRCYSSSLIHVEKDIKSS